MSVWYYQREQTVRGPLTAEELLRLAAVGKACSTDLVRHGAQGEWKPLAEVADALVEETHEAPAPPIAPGPRPQTTRARPAGAPTPHAEAAPPAPPIAPPAPPIAPPPPVKKAEKHKPPPVAAPPRAAPPAASAFAAETLVEAPAHARPGHGAHGHGAHAAHAHASGQTARLVVLAVLAVLAGALLIGGGAIALVVAMNSEPAENPPAAPSAGDAVVDGAATPAARRAPPADAEPRTAEQAREAVAEWLDARTKVIVLKDVARFAAREVRVGAAAPDNMPASAAPREALRAGMISAARAAPRWVFVRLEVTNLSREPLEFTTWRRRAGDGEAAHLLTASGQALANAAPRPAASEATVALARGETIVDWLAFAIDADIADKELDELQLAFSCSAVGRRGWRGYSIPRAMWDDVALAGGPRPAAIDSPGAVDSPDKGESGEGGERRRPAKPPREREESGDDERPVVAASGGEEGGGEDGKDERPTAKPREQPETIDDLLEAIEGRPKKPAPRRPPPAGAED